MKQFEVPFNFDYDFLPRLSRKRELFPAIKCIYLPAYPDDAMSTRKDIFERETFPKSYEEYVARVKGLMALGLPLDVLMQQNATMEGMEKYYDLGFRMFIINDDDLAKRSKERWPDIYVSLSITRTPTLELIQSTDFSMYDDIILFFSFCRKLDDLEALPKEYKYVLMCNNDCYYLCPWHNKHWFPKDQAEVEQCLKNCSLYTATFENRSRIWPQDLRYFDPYVDSYKLVDRLWTTDEILHDLEFYASRNEGADPSPEEIYRQDH